MSNRTDRKGSHSTTLIKLTKKYGSEVVDQLNQLLLQKAREQKIIRGRKLRVDTTVVESNIHHPTDAGLLQDGIKIITRTVKKIKEAGAVVRTKFQDRCRSAKNRVLSTARVLKRRTGEIHISESNEAFRELKKILEMDFEDFISNKKAQKKFWERAGKEAKNSDLEILKIYKKEQINILNAHFAPFTTQKSKF